MECSFIMIFFSSFYLVQLHRLRTGIKGRLYDCLRRLKKVEEEEGKYNVASSAANWS